MIKGSFKQRSIIIVYKIKKKKFIKIYKDVRKDFSFFIFYVIHIFLKINMHYISIEFDFLNTNPNFFIPIC